MSKIFATNKQLEILHVINKGNGIDGDGSLIPVDLDELLDRLSYKPTKQSLQFSIRALVDRKMIEKGERQIRRGRLRVVFLPTALGRAVIEDKSSGVELPAGALSELTAGAEGALPELGGSNPNSESSFLPDFGELDLNSEVVLDL